MNIKKFLDEVRFWGKIDVRSTDECWYWTGKTRNGYGRVRFNGENRISPRVAYLLHYGQFPNDLLVLHSDVCIKNAERDFGDGKISRRCCNPHHLRLGTHKDNAQDTKRQGRMGGTFPQGIHKYFGENHGLHKLSTSQVFSIRSDPRTNKQIAMDYEINPATVSRIKTGQRRKDG